MRGARLRPSRRIKILTEYVSWSYPESALMLVRQPFSNHETLIAIYFLWELLPKYDLRIPGTAAPQQPMTSRNP
jgi:hypothetical protein